MVRQIKFIDEVFQHLRAVYIITGDSGGPLMTTTPSDPSQWYIEGIVSFGAVCGSEGWPGIYTKVSSYLPWIKQNVRN